MSQSELLKRVVDVLDASGIPYMVTGSVVSSLQGEPRSSHDIDIVVLLPLGAVPALLHAFPSPDFYLSEDAIKDALAHQSQFNLLSLNDGEKVDFWLLTAEPFDQSRFARKYEVDFSGMRLQVSSPEDTILAKLRWCKLSGGSEKQFTDALRVFELQREKLDLAYLNHWAAQLGVEDLWGEIQAKATPL